MLLIDIADRSQGIDRRLAGAADDQDLVEQRCACRGRPFRRLRLFGLLPICCSLGGLLGIG
ncbi:hypothetical protein [Mesorhizobium sp.]|uniref:hypothetical protein n=1 Tax=Mesorhizobium sp. TaxID=1871066 RepID=UPI00338F5C9A